MKKAYLYGLIGVFFAVTIAVATVTSTIAPVPSQNMPSSISVGTVIYSLPPGGGNLTGRPTDIRFVVYDYNATRNFADVLIFYTWVPSLNIYSPIAIISDQPPNDQIKAVWNNTAIYLEVNSTVIRNNLKTVADNQLNVWLQPGSNDEDAVLMANLTVPVTLDFTNLPPAVFGTNLTVPALTLMFRGVADGFYHQETFALPSRFIITTTHTDVPAWVRLIMPTWLGGQTEASGTILLREASVIAPPA